MELVPATFADSELILGLFESSPTYFLKVEGTMPSMATVKDALESTPRTRTPYYLKEFVIVRDEGGPIGTAELHYHHPEKGVLYIGLLQIGEEFFGRGIGREAYRAIERRAHEKYGCTRVRLGVSDDNDVSGFWSRVGFRANGRTYTWQGERKANNVVEYEKPIDAPSVIETR